MQSNRDETESDIPSFVFVDGRKYLLAETEDLPETEILSKITPPPREISDTVRNLVRINYGQELSVLVVSFGCFIAAGATWLAIGVNGIIIAFSVFLLPVLPFIVNTSMRVYAKRKQIPHTLWLLQNGCIGRGRFYRICPSGKKFYHIVEMELTYQFTVQDGNTFNTTLNTVDYQNRKKLLAMTDETLRLVLYDENDPSRNVLLESLSSEITFDEFNNTFRASPRLLIKQVGTLIAMAGTAPLCAVFWLYFLH